MRAAGQLKKYKFLFFFSGSASLMYEVVWIRLFSDLIGSTALSMATFFSTFLMALALGAYLAGRFISKCANPLRIYAYIELGIGCLALLSSYLLFEYSALVANFLPNSSGLLVIQTIRIALCSMIIGPPTLLMGATLTVLVNALPFLTSNVKDETVKFYGWNTVGAAFGGLITGFILIWQFGLAITIGMAICLNIFIGFISLFFSLSLPPSPISIPVDKNACKNNDPFIESIGISANAFLDNKKILWFLIAFASGFYVMGYEVLWGRLSKFLLGDRTIATSALLFLFVTGLGSASLVAPYIARKFSHKGLEGIIKLVSVVLCSAAILNMVFGDLTLSTISGEGISSIHIAAIEPFNRFMHLCVLMFIPVFLLGLVFPLVIWSQKETAQTPGKILGRLYLVNATGAVFGSIFVTFLFCQWVGTVKSLFILSITLCVMSCVLYYAFSKVSKIIWGSFGLLFFLLFQYGYPTNNSLVQLRPDETLVQSHEDAYGIQLLVKTEKDYFRIRNNKISLIYDLGHWQTSHAQEMAAYLSIFFARDIEDVLNIGTGYGITAGAFTLFSGVKSIETVELLPFVIRNQKIFSGYNFNYTDDERVRLIQGDGRHYLQTTNDKYDVITVNVLDPYLPGSSSLYTTDFWQLAKSHLKPGGVYTQLFWGEDLGLLVKGIKTVFDEVMFFPAYGSTSYNIVAFRDPITNSEKMMHIGRFQGQARQHITELSDMHPEEYFQDLISNNTYLHQKFDLLYKTFGNHLHTDDYPILEYRWFHGVDEISVFDSPMVY